MCHRKTRKGSNDSSMYALYGMTKQTVSDLRKKYDIRKFVLKCNVEKKASAIKRVRKPQDQSLDDAVYKWFCQLRSSGLVDRGVEIHAAAERLAKQLQIKNFKVSSGWLFSADVEAIGPFRQKLHDILKSENIQSSQLYNYDEKGLYWSALPESTQASTVERNTPDRKTNKDRVSVLL
ncbi:Tc5 transposase DNA-binding domain [Popillia japonica]|uniref:Tc5 transposase DNA-binding domain n=1 Tax=Popillia japonica TaxID=7064 RepID=A0AAW1JZ85_POPJA